jgi:hypothetical protein
MNIATINEILFPFTLFFGYFCLACLLVSKQQQAANHTAEIKRAFSAEFDPEPLARLKGKNHKSQVKNEDILLPFDFCLLTSPKALPPAKARKHNTTAPLSNPVLITPAPKPELSLVPSVADSLKDIDLDRLPLRQARKVARVLGIKQKCNGKDKPLKFLRAEIKQRLKEEPTAAQTIQALLAA